MRMLTLKVPHASVEDSVPVNQNQEREVTLSSIAESQTLRKTSLNAVHRQLGAKMVDFGGWDMPVEYPSSGGIMKEHLAVRNGVGMFDVSHMGDILIRGPEALMATQWISMNDASKLAQGISLILRATLVGLMRRAGASLVRCPMAAPRSG